MPRTKSILRYPGGKTQLSKFVDNLIQINDLELPICCEPFSGGSGISMDLLLNNKVDSIILNDYDPAIYSTWYSVLHESERLIEEISNCNISIDEWYIQKSIYNQHKDIPVYNFDLAFATLFLNRTNRAGIITGGPIGGYKQNSRYLIDCRFNKVDIINKIQKIAEQRHRIELYHYDGKELIQHVLLNHNPTQLFTFFDPPYYKQGAQLYKNSFNHDDHIALYNAIREMDNYHWITTYDRADEIRTIYQDLPAHSYGLQYSARIPRREQEYLFASPITMLESYDKVILE